MSTEGHAHSDPMLAVQTEPPPLPVRVDGSIQLLDMPK